MHYPRNFGTMVQSCTCLATLALVAFGGQAHGSEVDKQQESPPATREFELRGDRAFLGGEPIELWGLRCGNALFSPNVTERHVRALDNMAAHGINLIGCYIQGSNAGWPNPDGGLNGFSRDGALDPAVAERLEWLVREADARGMVVMVGLFSPRKDQELRDDVAIERAVRETGEFLERQKLRNVFVDLVHEFGHPRVEQALFTEPDGDAKKALLAGWFKAVAPGIEVGVCPYEKAKTGTTFAGMDVRIIQKGMAIPSDGFVVNVETQKQDAYENDGVFNAGAIDYILNDCEVYRAAPNAALMLHAAYIQGIGNFSGTAPHPEMGGRGATSGDRGVRVFYEWVRDNVGRWDGTRHVVPAPIAESSAPTREFEVRGARAYLGGAPVKLWGLRASNALMTPAVTQRLLNNLDNFTEHGINLVSVALQGTNGGFPDVDAGPNAFAPDGALIPGFARRLETVIRAADARGMVVCVVGMMPRKDQLLRDEAAVQRAIEELATLLESRGLRNVMVNLFQEFDHPTRIDHDIFQEPNGDGKKAQLTAWFKAIAPDIEVGIVSNHLSGSAIDYTGCDVRMFHESIAIPDGVFSLNTETPDEDLSGNEGVFQKFHRARMEEVWRLHLASDSSAMLFRSPYIEDVRGVQGTGPNLEMGGYGTGTADRGVRFYFDWLKKNVGSWRYPEHGLGG